MKSLPQVLFILVFTLAARAEDKIDFNRDIRPLISDRCYKCHGPDAKNQKSDFRLDTREKAVIDLGGFAGITPGDLDLSEVHHRIRSDDKDEVMPPPKSKLSLNDKERDLLDRWIEEGAKYDTHWAFKPIPKEVPVPKTTNWSRNRIDAFILDTILGTKLKPRPEATREKWLRRATFDLTGLPPTLEELDAFLADTTKDAYEKVVDRLLDTDAYAERMTSEWLDVARYSDSYGYQVDRERFVWPWRDWVIRAFRENLSYDQFITCQLAGDLLPNATKDQIQATTFNRLHPQKVEGGSVPEEFRIEYVSDRLHTFGTAFLGLTLECCRCHDHKYDPIKTKEYYQLSSFFANVDEAGLYSYFTPDSIPTPTLLLTNDDQDRQIAEKSKAIAAAEEAVKEVAGSADGAFEQWLAKRTKDFAWHGLQAHVPFDDRKGGALPDRVRKDKPSKTSGNNKSVEGVHGQGLQLTGDDAVHVQGAGAFARTQPFSIGLWINTPEQFERAVIWRRSKAWTDAGSRGYELLFEDGKLSAALIHFDPGNSIRVRGKAPLPANSWHHVTVTYDGSSRAGGLKLYLDGAPLESEIIRDKLTKNIEGGGDPDLRLGERFRDVGFKQGKVDELHVFTRELTAIEVAQLSDHESLEALLSTPAKSLNPKALAQLRDYFLATAHQPYADALATLKAARQAKRGLIEPIKEIMVMREMEKPRQCYVLTRGMYSTRGEAVPFDTPAVLPPFPVDQPRNRLGLAKWLTSPDHPLTARVTANRYWQMFFGNGLVRTPEDFGSQGRPPSHPELLDWLARDFVESGWDLQHFVKQIVLSATYRQSTLTDKKSRELDPKNIYLARGTTERLSAEMIRDNALALSGLLVKKTGGKSVKPYEVAVSFKPAKPDKGEGLYRRSLYTWWRRTAPAPVMMTLNASKRDVCRVRREVTASPLQAFVLLNGPQFVEASRVMGAQLLKKHKDAPDALVAEAYRAFTSRNPTVREAKILRAIYDEQLAHFEANPDKATALLKTGAAPQEKDLPPPQQAAATVLVNAIMNLDEAITKR
jgi:hypothetical protein